MASHGFLIKSDGFIQLSFLLRDASAIKKVHPIDFAVELSGRMSEEAIVPFLGLIDLAGFKKALAVDKLSRKVDPSRPFVRPEGEDGF
jgi:hypothetical protein